MGRYANPPSDNRGYAVLGVISIVIIVVILLLIQAGYIPS